jgi:hypothetical protein
MFTNGQIFFISFEHFPLPQGECRKYIGNQSFDNEITHELMFKCKEFLALDTVLM